jgi:hypothetical protein
MLAGTGGGKTTFGPWWLKDQIEERGPGDYLAVTATYPLLKFKMQPEFLNVFDYLYGLGVWREADKVFQSHDKLHGAPAWRVIFGSATNPESIESATANAAWCDEAGQHQFQRQAYEAIRRRVNVNQGRILFTTTLYEFGWFKTEIYDRWMSGDSDIDVIQFDSTTNPAFPPSEYQKAKDTLPRWKFDLFYRGVFTRPAGLIYDSFDEQVCKISRFALPVEWPRYVGHDFGPNNTAAVWFAQDPGTGYLYAYREYLAGGLSAFDHAQRFIRLSQGENVIRRTGGANHEDGWRESFSAAGWPIVNPRLHEVEAGINRVYGWHQQNKLFVFDDLETYLDEKLSYSRKLDENYQPLMDIDQKSRFHLMDAERYALSDFSPETLETKHTVPVYRNWNGDNENRRSKRFRRNRDKTQMTTYLLSKLQEYNGQRQMDNDSGRITRQNDH